MNNDQFRKLILANSAKESSKQKNGGSPSTSRPAGGIGALGSRQKASIPMTPRSVTGRVDFARQLAERNQDPQKQKKFRTAAPKGSKLATGYVDRARTRQEQEEDERAARLEALEEALKKEEIDRATYERLSLEIAGGDLSSTHLIKGLDFKLLERVRKGEDVFSGSKPAQATPETEAEPEAEPEAVIDDEFERLEESEVHTIEKERTKKKGQLATVALAPGKKRTRDQILAELKAAREAAKAKAAESALGSRFKKIGAPQAAGSHIERDSKGREVLIIVDEDGHEKRKVRRIDASDAQKEREAFVPDKTKVLGMEVPEFYAKKQQEEAEAAAAKDVDIFDDAGSDYDPLAGIESESEEEAAAGSEVSKAPIAGKEERGGEEEAEEEEEEEEEGELPASPPPASKAMPPPPKPPQAAPSSRNYFKDSKTGLVSEAPGRASALNDPAVLAALRKAKALNAAAKSEEEEKEAERQQRLKKLLEQSERDADDLDMGFGTNRLEDEEDLEENPVKLAAWGDEDDDGGRSGGKSKRKRGPKKRKGDVNSAADVMRVIEQRKAAGA